MDDRSRTPEFYKVLLPGFCKQMMIPPGFTRYVEHEKHRTATILSPLGKFWHIQLKRHGGNVFFADGWEEFARAQDFSVGLFLVFHYEGNMIFTLRVYDCSGCEKVYTAEEEEEKEDDDNEEEDDDDEDEDDEEDEENEEVSTEVEDDEDYEEEEDNNNEVGVERAAAKKTDGPSSSVANRNPNIFVCVIHENNMADNKLVVPKEFCKLHGLNKGQGLVLKDEKGRSWLVQFRTGTHWNLLRGGWANFSSANDLGTGDICTFELISKREMHVTIKKHRT